MTSTFSDDFESGGLTAWPVTTGSVSAATAAALAGTYGLRVAPANTAATVATSTTRWTQSFYTWALVRAKFRVVALPAGTTADMLTVQNATQSNNFDFFFNNTTGTFWFDLQGGVSQLDTGVVPELGHIYDLQAKVFYGGTTWTAEIQLDGVTYDVVSATGQSSSFVRSLHLGTTSTTKTYTVDVDDVSITVSTTEPEFAAVSTNLTVYTTLTLLKKALKITDTDRDSLLNLAIEAASRQADNTARGRSNHFYLDTTATARILDPIGRVICERGGEVLLIPDVGATAGLTVEVGEDPTWTDITANIRTMPVEAPANGWPIESLLYRRGRFRTNLEVRVTARWGWPTVPKVVEQAVLIQAQRLYKRKDSPEGVLGSAEWGAVRVGRLDPDVAELLRPLTIPGIA